MRYHYKIILLFILNWISIQRKVQSVLKCHTPTQGIWIPRNQLACSDYCTQEKQYRESLTVLASVYRIYPQSNALPLCKCERDKVIRKCDTNFWGTETHEVHHIAETVGYEECIQLSQKYGCLDSRMTSPIVVDKSPNWECAWVQPTYAEGTITRLTPLRLPIIYKPSPHFSILSPEVECQVEKGYCMPFSGLTVVWNKIDQEELMCESGLLLRQQGILYSQNLTRWGNYTLRTPGHLFHLSPVTKDRYPCIENAIDLYQSSGGLIIDLLKTSDKIPYMTYGKIKADDTLESDMKMLYSSIEDEFSTIYTELNYIEHEMCHKICDLDKRMNTIYIRALTPETIEKEDQILKLIPGKNGWCITPCEELQDFQILGGNNSYMNISHKGEKYMVDLDRDEVLPLYDLCGIPQGAYRLNKTHIYLFNTTHMRVTKSPDIFHMLGSSFNFKGLSTILTPQTSGSHIEALHFHEMEEGLPRVFISPEGLSSAQTNIHLPNLDEMKQAMMTRWESFKTALKIAVFILGTVLVVWFICILYRIMPKRVAKRGQGIRSQSQTPVSSTEFIELMRI